MFKQAGFLGTGATFGADLTLVVQILFFLAIIFGVVAQLRHRYKWHDRIMTPIVALNLFFIIFLMAVSLRKAQVVSTLPNRPGDPYYLAAGVHALLGTVTEGLAIYCLLAGWKILPRKIGRLKYFMRTTAVLWTITFAFGLATYFVWYLQQVEAVPVAEVEALDETTAPLEPGAPPPPRRVMLQDFAFQPQEITVVVGTRVIWVNQDNAPHNVTNVEANVGSDNYFQGEAYEHTFRSLGTFHVYCTLHGNETSGMASIVHVVEASEENVAQLAAEPTPANAVPPTPTPVPPVPPAPVSLIDPPEADETVAGIMAFRDTLAASDSVTLVMSEVQPPPAGMRLHAWLTGADGRVFHIGQVTLDDTGRVNFDYRDPEGQNLMAHYDGVQLTLEPEDDDNSAPGDVVYSGQQPANAYSAIRLITAAAPDTPAGKGYGVAGRLQAEEVIRHARYLQLAFDLGSIADAQRHAEHIVNVLEGEQGEFFGNHDGAHGVQNPGDDYGVIPHIGSMKEAALQASASDDATRAIRTHAEHVDIATDSALEWATMLRQAALAVTSAPAIEDTGPQVETINTLSQRLLIGEDTDGDGHVSLTEGGIFIAYQHAQYMGAVGIIAGSRAAVVDPSVVSPPSLESQLATGEVVVNMLDFRFSPETLTIPAGTRVRFVNAGQAQHSATADDRSWDTGLFGPGGEAVITFDEPGFYPFYCLLHGTPGNTGMAGSITVVAEAEEVESVAPTPTPEEAAPTEAPLQFSIEMLDFTYSTLTMTVPAGSTVTWFNTGEFEHSATADDGSWDTSLLANGEQASVTFDEPGVYPYYCTLHGAPGGQGMAATLIVTEQ